MASKALRVISLGRSCARTDTSTHTRTHTDSLRVQQAFLSLFLSLSLSLSLSFSFRPLSSRPPSSPALLVLSNSCHNAPTIAGQGQPRKKKARRARRIYIYSVIHSFIRANLERGAAGRDSHHGRALATAAAAAAARSEMAGVSGEDHIQHIS